MTDQVWNESRIHAIGMILSGDAIDEVDQKGSRIADDTLLILLNAKNESARFKVPKVCGMWEVMIHTFTQEVKEGKRKLAGGDILELEGRSVVVMGRTS